MVYIPSSSPSTVVILQDVYYCASFPVSPGAVTVARRTDRSSTLTEHQPGLGTGEKMTVSYIKYTIGKPDCWRPG